MTETRVRIAPSPTGTIHLGLARTALFNWAWARRMQGKFLLRIEDTDRERSTEESERAILEGLAWLGLDWDEGPDVGGPHAPYRQSERSDRYRVAASTLLMTGKAYPCFCSSERLSALREEQQAQKQTPAYDRLCRDLAPQEAQKRAAEEPFVVRFKVPDGKTEFTDAVRGDVSFDNREVDDWIMVRTGGVPTYNFVVVCDDADMRITHVLRGEEHLVNTPKQILLYRAMGLEPPAFGHLPLMLGPDKKKLSKRAGDTSLEDYRAKGYPRDAIVNFLCLQGWALDGETEIFSVSDLVENFDPRNVSKGGSIFDFEKFRWLAGEYIRRDSVERLAERCAPFVEEAGLATVAELESRGDWFQRVVKDEQERIHLYSELPARIAYLFAPDDAVEFDPKAEKNAKKSGEAAAILGDYLAWLRAETNGALDAEAIRAGSKAWVAERELKMPQLFQPLRCALTGLPGGPDLFDVMVLLGHESTVARIEHGKTRLAQA